MIRTRQAWRRRDNRSRCRATTIYERGNATLTFVPTKGAPIESFSQGTHTATVIFWKVLESRQRSQSYTWTFSVF